MFRALCIKFGGVELVGVGKDGGDVLASAEDVFGEEAAKRWEEGAIAGEDHVDSWGEGGW